ncbi:hypothetical protein [Staphylococcus sp. LKG3-3]|uniref:hypothetical protein n=1 Tax=Staphylococcus sp. LKG3-3 TaxID=3399685 RepID=UPI003D3A982C
MAYEYEDKLLDYANGSNTYEEYKSMSQELQEVYRKAKAWDNYIAEVRERVKITVNTDDDIEKETQEVIDYYMERD